MPTPKAHPVDDTAAIRHLNQRLVTAYADRYPASYVESVVATAYETLAAARVRIFVPIFVERLAREKLDAPAEPAGVP